MSDSFEPQPPPPQAGAIRLKLVMSSRQARLDTHLLEAMRGSGHADLSRISRSRFKRLFDEKKVLIKGQPARPASALHAGTTWVDILWEQDT